MQGSRLNLHHLAAYDQQDENDYGDDLDLSLSLAPPLPPSLPIPNPARDPPPSSSSTPNPTLALTSWSLSLRQLLEPSLPTPYHARALSLSPSSTPNSVVALFSSSSNLAPNPTPTEVSRLPSPTTNPTSSPASPSPSPVAPTRWRRQLLRPGKSEIIPAPYPWAKDRRATIYNLEHLVHNGIVKIVGTMKCRKCEKESEIEYDLIEKFREVERFIVNNQYKMFDRAPDDWNNPSRQDCMHCGKKHCVGALIGKKRDINWLFLFLGQMVGFCSLEQLKYFCKHTRNHQTGSRNRLLYIAYLSLCKQLNPNGPNDL